MNIALTMNATAKTEIIGRPPTRIGMPVRRPDCGCHQPETRNSKPETRMTAPVRLPDPCGDTLGRLPRLELAHASRGARRDYYRALRAAEMAAWEAADRRRAAL